MATGYPPSRDDGRPRAAVRNSAEGPALHGAEQGTEEEGNLAPDQPVVPPLRPARHGDLRRQADAVRLQAGHARRYLDRHGRHADPDRQGRHPGRSQPRSEGNRQAVLVGSGHVPRALQQRCGHLGQGWRQGRQGDDGTTGHRARDQPSRRGSAPGIVQLHLHDG
ncbi:hypothetical protein D3C72_1469900 [compost metagenome]